VGSEVSYAEGLHELLCLFLLPIRDMMTIDHRGWGRSAEREDFLMFTSTVEQMCMLHQSIVDALKQATIKVGSEGDLSPIFRRVGTAIQNTYPMYLNRMMPVREGLERRMQRDSSFMGFLTDQSRLSKMSPGLGLSAFLIQPLQRMVAYGLLVDRLIKNTPPEDVNLPKMREAFQVISEAQTVINNKQKEYKKLEAMQAVIRTRHNFVAEGRVLLLDTHAMQVVGRESMFQARKEKPLHIYLLSDQVLITYPIRNLSAGAEKVHELTYAIKVNQLVIDDFRATQAEVRKSPDLAHMVLLQTTEMEIDDEDIMVRTKSLACNPDSPTKQQLNDPLLIRFVGGEDEKKVWKKQIKLRQVEEGGHSLKQTMSNKSEMYVDLRSSTTR